MSTITRPVTEDEFEVVDVLIGAGLVGPFIAVYTDTALTISSDNDTAEAMEAALVGFVPTMEAGDPLALLPSGFRAHAVHLRDFYRAQRAGELEARTAAFRLTAIEEVLADLIRLEADRHVDRRVR